MDDKKIDLIGRGNTFFYRFDADIGFWGVPHIDKEVFFEGNPGVPIRVKHNSEGNRDEEFTPASSGGAIVCLGGSHTWGQGATQHLRYTDRLTAETGKRFVNLGHVSMGLDQVCLALLTRARWYSPRVIVVEQYPWSLHRVLNTYVNRYLKPYFYICPDEKLKLQKLPVLAGLSLYRKLLGAFRGYKKELQEFRSGIEIVDAYDPRFDPIYLYWKSNYYDYMYSLVDKILGVIRDHCSASGYKLIFFLTASHEKFGPPSGSDLVDYDLPAKRFSALLKKNDIDHLDMSRALLEEHSQASPVIQHDSHINEKGHGVVARVLKQELETRGWI